jgi:hypothetical protein
LSVYGAGEADNEAGAEARAELTSTAAGARTASSAAVAAHSASRIEIRCAAGRAIALAAWSRFGFG